MKTAGDGPRPNGDGPMRRAIYTAATVARLAVGFMPDTGAAMPFREWIAPPAHASTADPGEAQHGAGPGKNGATVRLRKYIVER